MKWETVKLSDCCISITDGDHLPPPKAKTGIPFVTISDIVGNRFDFSNTMFVPKSYYDSLADKRKAQKGDVLYSVVGSFGIPVLIKDNTPFAFQRHIAILRPDNEIILSEFLYYTMMSKSFYAKADAAAIGAAQRTISLAALRNIEISIPDIDTQKKIVEIISPYDNLIENSQKQIKLLEEAAQRLYKEWFVDLRFPGYENTKTVDGVPEGWRYYKATDVFEYIRGKSYTSKEISEDKGTLMVNLKNIKAFGGYNRNSEKRYTGKYSDSQSLSAGDVIMGVTDMTQERRLVGHVAIVPDLKEPMTFSMDIIKLIPIISTSNFVYSLLHFGGYSNQISRFANGVNVLHLKPEVLTNIEVLMPTNTIIEKYDSIFEKYRQQIEILQNKIGYAEKSRDMLLPRLMSGEVEV